MEKHETNLPGVWELRPKILRDSRGFFLETYHQRKFASLRIRDSFVQDNFSQSAKGTLRGLHYQLKNPQSKICRVVAGAALDIAVDIRIDSPNFGKWTSLVLSAEEHNQIYIPEGFAHGFLALSDNVQFFYKCSDFYNAADEHGIRWNDPDIGIAWNIENPLISDKDARLPGLHEMPREFLPHYTAL